MTTGERIKVARKNAGLTQKLLGEKLGVSYQTIAQWENGLRNPKFETLRKISKEINCPITDLLTADDIPFVRIGYEAGHEIGRKEWIEYLEKMLGYSFSDTEQEIANLLAKLNDEGQQKAVERIEELTELPKYRKLPESSENLDDEDGAEDPYQRGYEDGYAQAENDILRRPDDWDDI